MKAPVLDQSIVIVAPAGRVLKAFFEPEALHAWQQLDTHRPPSTPSVTSPPR